MDFWEQLPLFASQRDLPPDVRERLRAAGLTGYRLQSEGAGAPGRSVAGQEGGAVRQRVLLAQVPALQAQHAEEQRGILGGEVRA